MAIPLLIVGPTGAGKSTSLRNMPRHNTAFLNCENKPLPFRDHNFAMIANITSYSMMIAGMQAAENRKDIQNVLVDSVSMLASELVFPLCKSSAEGFEMWGKYKDLLLAIIRFAKTSRKNYVFTALEKGNQDHTQVNTFVADVQGSLKGQLESHFSIVLRAMSIDDMDVPSGIRYVFATNKIPNERISAKSPIDMFPELYVDNDIVRVYQAISQYYSVQ